MSYTPKILEAYDRIGFKPRGNQLDQVNRVVGAFLDEGMKTVILSAPTGVGKSLIGAVVSEVVHSEKYPGTTANASFLISSTNILGKQYHDTFANKENPDDLTFRFVKGANNYECSALSTEEEPQSAENCSVILFKKSGMEAIINEHCSQCEFHKNKLLRDRARHLILNYAYYFTDRLGGQRLQKRTMAVFDEAHLVNDLYVDFCAISFTEKGLMVTAQEVTDNLQLGSTEIFKQLKMVRDHLAKGKIKDETYMTYIKILADIYTQIVEAAQDEAVHNIRSPKTYLRLVKLSKKYMSRSGKILDLLEHDYPHVFEYKAKDPKTKQPDHEVTIKPIFISDMFESLENADHNLLMSATINEQYAKRTMTLSPKERVKYIRLEPQFPRENKKVVFFKPQLLNYSTMKDPDTIKRLCASAYQIVQHHGNKGERGLILAPSFTIIESIAESLRGALDKNIRVFEHVRGEKLADHIEAFKAYTKGPAVFLTPSGYEGLDLPQDLSRYQVIIKTPWAALGDKRIKTVSECFPDIYQLSALMRLVQGAGRSVRGPTDFATTYLLDQSSQHLMTSTMNEWKDEFLFRFNSIL